MYSSPGATLGIRCVSLAQTRLLPVIKRDTTAISLSAYCVLLYARFTLGRPVPFYCRSAEHTCNPSGAHTPFSNLLAHCWWKRESKYLSVDLLPVMRASSLYLISSRALPSRCAGCGCNAALHQIYLSNLVACLLCNTIVQVPGGKLSACCHLPPHLISCHPIPSSADVPDTSVILRAHTPLSNLLACLWFNEVHRFSPYDHLSFAVARDRIKKRTLAWNVNMFNECEKRSFARSMTPPLDHDLMARGAVTRVAHQDPGLLPSGFSRPL